MLFLKCFEWGETRIERRDDILVLKYKIGILICLLYVRIYSYFDGRVKQIKLVIGEFA